MNKCLHQVNFPGVSTSRFLSLAQAGGFQLVELHPFETGESMRSVAAAVAASGCNVLTVNPLPDWFRRDGRLSDDSLKLIDAAVQVHASYIVAPSPVYIPGADHEPTFSEIAHSLSSLEDSARHAAVKVAFEPVGLSIKRPGGRGAISSIDDAVRLVQAVSPYMPIVLDSFCQASAGYDLRALRLPAGSNIALLQIADWDGVGLSRKFPGSGKLDLREFVAQVMTSHPMCPISLEVFPFDGSSEADHFTQKVSTVLRSLLPVVV